MKRLLILAAFFAIATPGVPQDEPESLFEDPVRLTAEGKPINETEGMLYPTPVLIDIDGDKQPELVVGDLFGYLRVYEKDAEETDLTWGKGVKLQSNGKDLKLPNW